MHIQATMISEDEPKNQSEPINRTEQPSQAIHSMSTPRHSSFVHFILHDVSQISTTSHATDLPSQMTTQIPEQEEDPIDRKLGSRVSDERRKRNAEASARSRQRKREVEINELKQEINKLKQEVDGLKQEIDQLKQENTKGEQQDKRLVEEENWHPRNPMQSAWHHHKLGYLGNRLPQLR